MLVPPTFCDRLSLKRHLNNTTHETPAKNYDPHWSPFVCLEAARVKEVDIVHRLPPWRFYEYCRASTGRLASSVAPEPWGPGLEGFNWGYRVTLDIRQAR